MKKEIWLNYLESQVERCRQEGEALSQDCREDEARRAKIQGNIFQICATVYQALEAHLPPQELEAAYRRKLEVLPEKWRPPGIWPKPTGIWPGRRGGVEAGSLAAGLGPAGKGGVTHDRGTGVKTI